MDHSHEDMKPISTDSANTTANADNTAPVAGSFTHAGADKIPLVIHGARRASGLPLIVYFHGGRFNSGTLADAEPIARALCGEAVVALVDYPLAPGCRFPDTVEIAYDALRWAWSQAARHGANPARVFAAGDQAGGNLAAAAAMVARDRQFVTRGAKALAGQILIRPLLDPSQATASMRASAECPCRAGWSDYLPRVSDAEHPYAAPLLSCRLAGLAPALIFTAEGDPCRDEATAYAAKLAGAGVDVSLRQSGVAEPGLADPSHPQFGETVSAIIAFCTANAAPSRGAR